MDHTDPVIEGRPLSALDRARLLSQALAEAARQARIARRSRRGLAGGGFHARRGARAWRLAIIISFTLLVVLPSICGAIYYGLIAADEYVAEAKFTVSGGELSNAPDAFGAISGVPALAIVQDTQIVANYIHSRAALEKLEKMIDIRALYATPDADYFSRFKASKPIEKFLRYWEHMSDVSISLQGGIVTLKIYAFKPQDAARIANAVLDISEALINELNERMNRDAITNAKIEMERTQARLLKTRLALESTRNEMGLLDAEKTAEALGKLITEARKALLDMEKDYASDLKYVSESAPQIRALKSRIDAGHRQIAELEAKLTATSLTAPQDPTLATSMTKFGELDLERKVAERLYAGAAASLEIARVTAEHKMMYLNAFVKPMVPQEPQYPRRWLMSAAILGGSLASWGLCGGLAAVIRNYMA